ncbi:MAG TPA: hypothetical protein ENK18_09430 [Deltaproteobacteria bacterium]|nr:hypothetical protein [Deltaproteobacteria bacterium]
MLRIFSPKLSVLGLILVPVSGWGQTISFNLEDDLVEDLGVDPTALEEDLTALIGEDLKLLDASEYLSEMAYATQLSLKGMGVDYASNPSTFVVGGAVGSASSGGASNLTRGGSLLPQGGFGAQLVLLAGLNLGQLVPGEAGALNNLVVYVNGMSMAIPSSYPFTGRLSNGGLHLQVKLGGPVKGPFVEWGGIDLTTGYELSTYTLSLDQALPIGDEIGPIDMLWDATGSYTLSATSHSMPIEVSTNVRVTVLSLYGGLGIDLNDSSAVTQASLTGPVLGTVKDREHELGSGGVSFTDSGYGDGYTSRFFFGAQINITLLKLYGQMNLGNHDSFGGHLGVRIAL